MPQFSSKLIPLNNAKNMRYSRVVGSSDCHCLSHNCPGFHPDILRHSRIWEAADKVVSNTVYKKSKKSPNKITLLKIIIMWESRYLMSGFCLLMSRSFLTTSHDFFYLNMYRYLVQFASLKNMGLHLFQILIGSGFSKAWILIQILNPHHFDVDPDPSFQVREDPDPAPH